MRYYHKCTYIFHVKYPLFLSQFNQSWTFSTVFRKIRKYQISWKSTHRDSETDGRTDEQRNMTKLIVDFRYFAKAPKNELSLTTEEWLSHCFITGLPQDWGGRQSSLRIPGDSPITTQQMEPQTYTKVYTTHILEYASQFTTNKPLYHSTLENTRSC
jgi:hypothetical protein